MTRAEKTTAIAELKEKFNNSSFFYLTDSSTLTVPQVNKLRRLCFEKGVEMKVIKNKIKHPGRRSYGNAADLPA